MYFIFTVVRLPAGHGHFNVPSQVVLCSQALLLCPVPADGQWPTTDPQQSKWANILTCSESSWCGVSACRVVEK